MAERRFFLNFSMAPGDVSMLTALVRDIKLTYGARYDINVGTNFDAIWRHNPHLDKTMTPDSKGVEIIKMKYGITDQKVNRVHFLTDFYKYFKKKTKIHVPLLHPKADLHFTDDEKQNPVISGRYWIIVPGGKTDITNKFWSQVRYQQTVDRLRPFGLNFVQEGAVKKLCVHPPLDNVLSVVGMTSVRDLMVNILHAEGVICGVTFQMHLAGAMDIPCVVLGGAREEAWWEEYSNEYVGAFGDKCSPVKVPHRYLHTSGINCQDANRNGKVGCWKQRVLKMPDNAKHNNSLCKQPTLAEEGQVIPKCLDLITTDHVVESVMSYYEDGYLPPPSWSLEARNSWRQAGVPYVPTHQSADRQLQATA
jgi:ADP-heptose:LPS heptosyltransferase